MEIEIVVLVFLLLGKTFASHRLILENGGGADMLLPIPIFSKNENRKICELRRKRSLTSMLYMSFLR
jgi:hypothetical protein